MASELEARVAGEPCGEPVVMRESLLRTAVATLRRLAEEDAADKIVSFAYTGMSQRRVRVQLTILPGEVP